MKKRTYYENFCATIFERVDKMKIFPKRAKNIKDNLEEKKKRRGRRGNKGVHLPDFKITIKL